LEVIATRHKLTKMLTLTLDPKRLENGEPSDRYIRDCWRSLRVLLARKVGKSVDFFCVLEFQEKTELAHLHVLLSDYIEWKWIQKAWLSVGGGEHVDIRRVDLHRVVAYLSKYLTGEKITHTLRYLPKRARIFTTSRSIILWEKKKGNVWWLRPTDILDFWDATETHSRVRRDVFEDSGGNPVEMLAYFEAPPCQEALGDRDVIDTLKEAIPIWNAKNI
jgi:hypothetical protein